MKHTIAMKKVIIFLPFIAVLIGAGFYLRNSGILLPDEKVYVAVEGEWKIEVLDAKKQERLGSIDLAIEHEGGRLAFAPHNVQVAPNGKTVWVTANVEGHKGHTSSLVPAASAHGPEEDTQGELDEVVVIDPTRDQIIARIPIEPGVHLAHVVLTPDSTYAYVTAQTGGSIYKINAETRKIEKEISLPAGKEPHGIRISPDGLQAYIAMLAGKSLGILDLATDEFKEIPVGGGAVQAGITPNGKYTVLSLYDTKQLAVFDWDFLATTRFTADAPRYSLIALPDGAKGPIQMYPTPDSKFVYLADQGYYYNQPQGEMVYKIDLAAKLVVKSIKVGSAPHGVVVSRDGKYVYVTNLLSDDVSIIDTMTDTEVKRIKVGAQPNGISIWSKTAGGTP